MKGQLLLWVKHAKGGPLLKQEADLTMDRRLRWALLSDHVSSPRK